MRKRPLHLELLEERRLLATFSQAFTPLGSQVYSENIFDSISTPGEVDTITFDLDPGQTITVVAEGDASLLPEVELLIPGFPIAAGAVSPGLNRAAILQTVPTITGGTYSIQVSGADDTVGNYTLYVLLNAALEEESVGEARNNEALTAQDIDSAFYNQGTLGAAQAAVIGVGTPGPNGPLARDVYQFSLEDGKSVSLALETSAGATVELRDSDFNLLATGHSRVNATSAIQNFVDQTSDGVANTYFAVVADTSSTYNLVLVRDADFNFEPNSTADSAQDISTIGGASGFVLSRSGEEVTPLPQLEDTSIPIIDSFPGPVSSGSIPPDPTAAVGPEQLVALVNTDIAIYDKATGASLFQQSLNGSNGFFGSVGATTTVFDPWVLFDTDTNRFFAIAIDIASNTESNMFIAVSTDATPTSGDDWHKYKLDFTHDPSSIGLGSGDHFPDYPKLGVSEDAIWISSNYFPIVSGSGVYAGIQGIDKGQLVAGGRATIIYEEYFNGFSVFPLTQYESSTTQYFAETSIGSGNNVLIHAIDTGLATPVRTVSSVDVGSFDAPVDIPQPGGVTPADSIDSRIMTGVWREGSAWFAHAITDPAVGDGESLVRWYQVETNDFPASTPTLIQSGNIDPGPGVHAWIPAVAVDGVGNLGVAFAIGGTSTFLGAGFTGRLANDAPGQTTEPITVYANGLADYDITGGNGGRNRWGDYSGLAVDPSDDATFWAFNEFASTNNVWHTQFASFQLEEPQDEDWYQFGVQTGDILRIQSFTPASGPGEAVNDLEPSLELYDANGVIVPYSNATGNELLFHVAETTGNYRLRVFGDDSFGEYFVQIEGATGTNAVPEVIDTNPDTGSLISVFPQTYTVTYSESLLSGSIDAGDLLFAGLPATSVEQIDGRTLEFTIDPAANTGDGIYQIEIAADAFTDLQGGGSLDFSSSFEFDATGPVILSTLVNGLPLRASGVYDDGPFRFEATLSEDLFFLASARRGPFTPGPDDFVLFDSFSEESIEPLMVSYDPTTDIVAVEYEYLNEGDYTLTLLSGNGGLEDIIGNDLDGEPIGPQLDGTVTGDGNPGGDYFLNFAVDNSSPELASFVGIAPLGSLIYSSQGTTGLVNRAGDQDLFETFFEGGQNITVVLTPTDANAVLSLEILGITPNINAARPGEAIRLDGLPIVSDSFYEFRVSGNGLVGYELEVFRNAVLESAAGETDETNKLALDPSFVALGQGGRYGLLGNSNAEGRLTTEAEPNDDGVAGGSAADLPFANDISNSFVPVTRTRFDATVTGTISAGNDQDYDFFRFLASPGDVLEANLRGAPSNSGTLSDPYLRLYDSNGIQIASNDDFQTLESFLTFNSFSEQAEYYLVADSFGSSVGTYTLTASLTTRNPLVGGPVEPDVDSYTVDLAGKSGQHIDVVLSGLGDADFTGEILELLDDSGTVLATALAPLPSINAIDSNYDLRIDEFEIPDLGSNEYTLRFSAMVPGDYSLVVTESMLFETEPNNLPDGALRNLNTVSAALGHIIAADEVEQLPASLYGLDSSGNLFTLDLDTGVGTSLGILPTFFALEIEFNPATNQAIVSDTLDNVDSQIREIDLVSAEQIGSSVITTGIFTGLEWVGNDLYAAETTLFDMGGSAELRLLDPATGTSTLIGPTGQGDIFGLAYEESTDTLYGITLGGQLLTVNRTTGSARVIAATGIQAGSLEFGPDGQLYAIDLLTAELFVIDPTTGASSLVGQTGFSQPLGLALGPVPPPETLSPADVYSVELLAGQSLTSSVESLFDSNFSAAPNLLDAALRIFDPNGIEVAFDANSLDGKNPLLSITAELTGAYSIEVLAEAGRGEYQLNTSKGHLPGDFDANGSVNGADFLAWQRGFGKANPVLADGDTDGDADVDADDLAAWQSAYQTTEAPLASNPSINAPLPSALLSQTFAPSSTLTRQQVQAAFVAANSRALQSDAVEIASAMDLIGAKVTSDDALGEAESELPTAVYDMAFARQEIPPAITMVAEAEVFAATAEASESTNNEDESWLADEMLELVFG